MMDRFLFRGKRKDSGEWVIDNYAFNINGIKDLHFILDDDVVMRRDVDPTTIGQCTGLKDRNGKLIFEGDILKLVADELTEVPVRLSKPHVVTWRRDSWTLIDNVRQFARALSWMTSSGACAEIIGNIHDNPELLESTTNKPTEESK